MSTGVVAPGRARPGAVVRAVAIALLLLFLGFALLEIFVHADVHGPSPFALVPLAFIAYPLMGALILWQRGSHLVGWALLVLGIVILLMIGSADYAEYALANHPNPLPFGRAAIVINDSIWVLGIFLFAVLLPLTFPDGRLLSRRWLVVVALAALYSLMAGASNALMPGRVDGHPHLVRPFGLTGQQELLTRIADLSVLPGALALVGSIAAVVVRYRRSRGIERQQLKWFVFAALLIPLPLLLNGVGGLGMIAFLVVEPLLAVSVGLAVLRHGLYDIEVVISRTLVYGAMAAFITAVYVGIVVGIGTLVGSGGRPNLALSIVATAVVAVAFQPARERLQRLANRLVYGRRATPYEVLSEFSGRLADAYAADDVLQRMAGVLAEGTAAETAEVWLRTGSMLRRAAVHPAAPATGALRLTGTELPEIPGVDRAVTVRYQGELLGALTVSKRRGETLTPMEEKLLDDLAHQAGLVLKNVGLTADLQARLQDLQASRQRLVAAQDQERRRLERNLHDGAQQHLVALKVRLGLAESLLRRDPEKARQTIHQLKGDADEALTTLRDLARGIYPPLLAERGLVAALEGQVRKATVEVRLDADGVGRYPQDVEAAVYFCCLEAVQNVQKYAGDCSVRMAVHGSDASLEFEVADDGQGFDPATALRGSGLQNMSDRLEALGGALAVESSPGAGTRLRGTVPVLIPVAVS